MQLTDFDYPLPEHLIAQAPLAERTQSRLLAVDKQAGQLIDTQFCALLQFLRPGDCLVLNTTRVLPARLFGVKPTGGKVEVLIERVLTPQRALAFMKASKTPTPGTEIILADKSVLTVMGRQENLFELNCSSDINFESLLQQQGHMPLPPYIQRHDDAADQVRYQTVYADQAGAVAAPTAGLHFDDAMLARCEATGIHIIKLLLHVGAGTFQPVRTDDIRDHIMHREWCQIDADTVARLTAVKQAGGRIIAVGTTSVRCLETAAQSGQLQAFSGDTQLFIYPGYRFNMIDGLITNFHLPQSTLLMLVSAFAGFDLMRQAYQHAIAQTYRFFSYGDAMLIMDGLCKSTIH